MKPMAILMILFVCRSAAAVTGNLYVGWAQVDITPDRPVALVGQLHKRISQKVRDPLTATALAIETRGEDGRREQAILVSCDLLYIRKAVQDGLRQIIKGKLPDFDADKLLLNATHTHTGPGFADEDFGSLYDVSEDKGVMKASEYADFFVQRVAGAVVDAWQKRQPGGMSWALGHAVVGMNRRAHYFDGSTTMYGKTNRPDFANLEGYEDHGVEMLFFWDADKAPTGIVINIAGTAQETEGLSEVSADFWHEVRVEIRRRLGRDLFVLPQCAAAGDASPHLLFRTQAEEIMRQRRGLSRRQEIARRLVETVENVAPLAKQDIQTSMTCAHTVARVDLPPQEPPAAPFYTTDTITPIEFHVLRLGDIALATNPFELYLDYGVRIKARSPAVLTLLIQLSCQHCGYLPTEKAVQGGGYSADKFVVGPRGGQVLVEETVNRLNALWN
ncbi:MAG: hypothetical protein MUC88_07655 [Planctomycetes bacterium]|jgi:hypothetical protein|nr:hypothetical protein [Planctomycetota bacterium]